MDADVSGKGRHGGRRAWSWSGVGGGGGAGAPEGRVVIRFIYVSAQDDGARL